MINTAEERENITKFDPEEQEYCKTLLDEIDRQERMAMSVTPEQCKLDAMEKVLEFFKLTESERNKKLQHQLDKYERMRYEVRMFCVNDFGSSVVVEEFIDNMTRILTNKAFKASAAIDNLQAGLEKVKDIDDCILSFAKTMQYK